MRVESEANDGSVNRARRLNSKVNVIVVTRTARDASWSAMTSSPTRIAGVNTLTRNSLTGYHWRRATLTPASNRAYAVSVVHAAAMIPKRGTSAKFSTTLRRAAPPEIHGSAVVRFI